MWFLSRRRFLGAAGGFATTANRDLWSGNTLLSSSPRISAQDFEQYPGLLTPAADLFVRNHFESPVPDPAGWKIQITGAVARSLSVSLDELPDSDKAVTVMECAGNGVGVGGVGCVEFKGTWLARILSECQPAQAAVFARFMGADSGAEAEAGPARIPYSRIVPIFKAATGLLALEMNGAPLSADHGAPVRFVLPGSYGMNSVKWLRRIEILEEPMADFFTDQRFRRVSGGSLRVGVGDIRVKSIVVQPKQNAAIRAASLRAGGYAWVGHDKIARVELSFDAGAWFPAKLLARPAKNAWVPWVWDSGAVRAGTHTIAVRAFSASGESQAAERDPSRQDEYELNHYHRVRFMVRP